MRYLLNIILFILLVLSLTECNKKEKAVIQEKEHEQVAVPKEREIIEIQLSGSHNYKHEFKLSEIAEDVSYIPLETNPDCLIGNRFSQPKFTKEYIFIETGGIVFQYDKQGKFIRRINKIGQGPSECYTRYFAVGEKKDLIYILENWRLSIYIFDFSGKYIKTIKNPFEGEKGVQTGDIGCDKEGNLILSFSNFTGDMKYKYVVMDDNGEMLHKSPNYIKYNLDKGIRSISPDSYPIYKVGDDYCYSYTFNDTIFQINKDYTMSASYIIKLPNRLSLEDYMRESALDIDPSFLSNKNMCYGTREDKHSLYVYFGTNIYSKDYKVFCSCYNKQTRQLIENIDPNIKNDWDGGKDILIDPAFQDEDKIYIMLQPFKMKEMLADATNRKEAKYPEKQKAFKEMVDNMEEDDNPFIMIVKLK
jgi:hypothetical protein